MFQAALVAAVAVLLVQGSEARVEQSIAERASELRQAYIRDVEDKSSSLSSKQRDEARKQKVSDDGWFATILDDIKYLIVTPLKWLLNTLLFPIHVLQNAYYSYSLPKEEKAE